VAAARLQLVYFGRFAAATHRQTTLIAYMYVVEWFLSPSNCSRVGAELQFYPHGRAQDFSLGARPKGRRPTVGWAALPLPPARGLGNAVSSGSGVRGGAPAVQRFPPFSSLRMAAHDTIMLLIVDSCSHWGQDPRSPLAYAAVYPSPRLQLI